METKLGESRHRFEEKVAMDVVTPLKAFLEIDIKNITVSQTSVFLLLCGLVCCCVVWCVAVWFCCMLCSVSVVPLCCVV